jgi:cell division transport system permease protein
VSTRLRFFLGEAVHSLRTNMATTVAATVTVLIVLFWFGVFVALGSYMYSKVDQVRHDVKVSAYLQDGVTKKQREAVYNRLLQNPNVQSVQYVSKSEALARMKQRLGKNADIFRSLPGNPLPASFDAKLRNPDNAKEVATSVKGMAGVETGSDGVKYGGQTADRLLRTGGIIEGVIGGLILLLGIAAVLLIANTIRLSIFSRRREIEVMKLVGATNWFVRLPFMLEGMICGLTGAVLSIGLLRGSYDLLLRDRLQASQFSGDHVHALSFWVLALLLVLAGTGLGALGSALTMRRFLRI